MVIDIDIDIDIEILFFVECCTTCNIRPVGLLLRQTRINNDIVQCPKVLVSSEFDDSPIPLLMFSIGIYIFTFLYLNCFLHAVIYFVHCALSLIILFYICARCDTRSEIL